MQSGSVEANTNVGLVRQILTLSLAPRENGTLCSNETALCEFSEMWYGVFLWAVVSSLVIHLPAGLLALFTLRHHKYGRFMPVSILLMSIIGPVFGGSLTSAAIAGVYRAAGKGMISLEALILGVGQSFCVLVISFLRILATL
ncbi:transmembrane protein 170A-like [Acipenser ruthenus]|uniref:transmembrane protein 170A-like n=1 Tax=Acipenser ruthenus TaxID=7906 RepID=UPI0027424107|nr:transmembrane protein 170A-like [Acipenser ruthenus]